MTCSSTASVPYPTRLKHTDSDSSTCTQASLEKDERVIPEEDKLTCRICLSTDNCLLDPRQDSVLRPHWVEARTRSARKQRSAKISRWILKSCKCSGSGKAIHYGCLRECIISSLIFSSKFFDRVLCCTVCATPYQLEAIAWLAIEEDIRLLLDKFPYPDDWDKKPYAFVKHLKENRQNRDESLPLPHAAKAPELLEEMKEVDRGLSPTRGAGTTKK